ncbi:hypothetical protein D3C84_1227690 [compost metagenome]
MSSARIAAVPPSIRPPVCLMERVSKPPEVSRLRKWIPTPSAEIVPLLLISLLKGAPVI